MARSNRFIFEPGPGADSPRRRQPLFKYNRDCVNLVVLLELILRRLEPQLAANESKIELESKIKLSQPFRFFTGS